MEAGNILNHGVYGNPQGNITSGTFGQITGVQRELPGAADPPRAAGPVLDVTVIRGASALGLHTRPRAPLRRRAPGAWLARCRSLALLRF